MNDQEEPSAKRKRGQYNKYLYNSHCPVPKTTKWRLTKAVPSSLQPLSTLHSSSGSEDSALSSAEEDDQPDGSEDTEQTEGTQDEYRHDREADEDLQSDSEYQDQSSDDTESEPEYSDHEEEQNSSGEMMDKIYPGSAVSVLSAYCLLMEFKRLCKVPFSTMLVLLNLLQLLCPANNSLPTTKYHLRKFARKFASLHSKIDFCRSCSAELQSNGKCPSNKQCPKAEPNSMIIVSPEQALRKIISGNWTKIQSHSLTTKGEIGIVFNTDGVSPFKSSLITIWPIFISLINLPAGVRNLKRNIITCIFWFAKSKPQMSLLFSYFKKTLHKINTSGLSVKMPTCTATFYLKPLFGVFDLVAKAPILNMNQFNGKNGCPSCLHPGVRIGYRQTYPPGRDYTPRTTDSFVLSATQAERGGIVNGIKGRSSLFSIVDLATGAPIDYMHCVLEGVVKRLLDQWVSSSFQPFHLSKRKIIAIDNSLVMQRPPHDFSRAPRSILKHRKFWKASEFRNWLLFYCLPLIIDYQPPLYVHHFALLVGSIHILLQPTVTPSRIKAAELMLKDFVSLLPELYSPNDCTLNSHLLLHLSEHSRLWGPLWVFSAFPFENKNGYLMAHIHSPHKIADQLLFSLNLNQRLDSLHDQLLETESDEVLTFLGLSNLQKHGPELYPGSYVVGSTYTTKINSKLLASIKQVVGDCTSEICTFSRVYHRETIFYSLQYGHSDSKRNSSVCSFSINETEEYGIIDNFYVVNSISVVVVKPFSPIGSLLQTVGQSGRQILDQYASMDILGSFIIQVKYNITLSPIVIPLQSLMRKCVLVHKDSSPFSYIVISPNCYEHH